MQFSVPAFALRVVTPSESAVYLRNRLQQDSFVLPLRFSGMEENAELSELLRSLGVPEKWVGRVDWRRLRTDLEQNSFA